MGWDWKNALATGAGAYLGGGNPFISTMAGAGGGFLDKDRYKPLDAGMLGFAGGGLGAKYGLNKASADMMKGFDAESPWLTSPTYGPETMSNKLWGTSNVPGPAQNPMAPSPTVDTGVTYAPGSDISFASGNRPNLQPSVPKPQVNPFDSPDIGMFRDASASDLIGGGAMMKGISDMSNPQVPDWVTDKFNELNESQLPDEYGESFQAAQAINREREMAEHKGDIANLYADRGFGIGGTSESRQISDKRTELSDRDNAMYMSMLDQQLVNRQNLKLQAWQMMMDNMANQGNPYMQIGGQWLGNKMNPTANALQELVAGGQ